MGNSAIIIRTHGPHQNNRSYDAERAAARAVSDLKECGHDIITASVETGGTSIELVGPGQAELLPVTDPDRQARAAYERYIHASGGKSLVSGAELPGFDALTDAIKAAWRAAADPSAPRLAR